MKNSKKITEYNVGITCSIVAIIASILVIITNVLKKESIGVGIGLLVFSLLALLTNIKNKTSHQETKKK